MRVACKITYFVCVIATVLLLAGTWLLEHPMHESPRYASVHEPVSMLPLIGFSDETLINTGDAKALDQLPGVGEVIARRIIEVRALLGGFRLPEDLLLVKGIGEKTLKELMDAYPEPLVLLPEIAE